jgi:hypothetical protein
MRRRGRLFAIRSAAAFALAGALLCAPVCAESLGRLFFSPAERQALDQPPPPARVAESKPESVRAPDPVPVAPKRRAAAVKGPDPKVTGFVTRSSGKNTMWLNQKPLNLDENPDASAGLSR